MTTVHDFPPDFAAAQLDNGDGDELEPLYSYPEAIEKFFPNLKLNDDLEIEDSQNRWATNGWQNLVERGYD